ncbi:MAG: DNA-formamidopyrimidine glycosylase [Candidatus Levybacteria bacterium RIFCSPHIGHO2_01_FULL_37_17]|nr:MAG: DNA-formamidopyrimidine glycosylase [Candidatus Levybacteria bacterium RIFCSPHIGHO2_01_FULL_37_17]OGH36492.1 MAG: DNA-formamidopyrimidine glycosylase [Candidatus Levybacteria bacterium RIFCSPLOWO2_01_FULL_38_23]
MPELPEVETVKLGLQKYLVGHKILDVEIKVAKLFEGRVEDVVGAKVIDARRFGKGLVIDLSNKHSLAIHIKLTGQLIYRDDKTSKIMLSQKVGDKIPNQFTHVIFKLDKGAYLYYNDKRRFGWIRAVKTEDLSKMPFFKNMGPEPFKDLTFELFNKIISGKQTVIKPLLMDQTRIGGIGNIYANDALFFAGISPKRRAKDLTSSEIKSLYDSILKVMEKSMKYGGASELNFVNVLGQEGEYQHHSLAYGRQGEKCSKNDEGIIEKTFLAGRGTYFCPVHQK